MHIIDIVYCLYYTLFIVDTFIKPNELVIKMQENFAIVQ